MPSAAQILLLQPPAFTPLSIPGCALWLAADAISGLADGDPITTWPDRSANVANAVQGGAAGTRPTFKTSIANGKPVARFASASSQYLNNAAWTAIDGLAGMTLFFVCSYTSTAAAQYVLTTSGEKTSIQVSGNVLYRQIAPTPFNQIAFTSTALNIVGTTFDGSLVGAARLAGHLNGALQATVNTGTQPATLGSSVGFDVGRYITGANSYLNGDIAEIIVYNTALSTVNRRKIEAYLAAKYAITVT